MLTQASRPSLYLPEYEHDSCGTGFVADISAHASRRILEMGLESVENLTHRGAVSSDATSGDGAGVITQLPYRLLRHHLEARGGRWDGDREVGVGMIFFPREKEAQDSCRKVIADVLASQQLLLLSWRDVPVDESRIGSRAYDTRPHIEQVLVGRPSGLDGEAFERALFLSRKIMEARIAEKGIQDFYIPSFSHTTVVYKGMFVAPQLRRFFLDLDHPEFETAFVVFHQRFSTNTFPSWRLAQPFRMLAHNGEINTLRGNRKWMRAREAKLVSSTWGKEVQHLLPLVSQTGSDSESLDDALQVLVRSGRDLLHANLMLIPEAWENMPHMPPAHRAFYEYHACLMEPWDGPAAIAFSDGRFVGAHLDRNGLRPARYKVTDDGIVVMGSEVGLVPIPDEKIVEKGRLGPGMMIAVDLVRCRLLKDEEIKEDVCGRKPYSVWLDRELKRMKHQVSVDSPAPSIVDAISRWQVLFGYTEEEIQRVVVPMVVDGKEPVGSMGDDTPISVFSRRSRLLYSYFKQQFAQVTNPPIDPIREELVMACNCYLGPRPSFLEDSRKHAHLIELPDPILTNSELESLRTLKDSRFQSETLDATFAISDGAEGLERGARRLCEEAAAAIGRGKSLLILSDRAAGLERAPIPMLLAVSGVHQHLLRTGQRLQASLLAETAEPRDVHHFACLLGYGAVVNPYLAFEVVRDLVEHGELRDLTLEHALKNYLNSLRAGILKIMSKMGISTLASYLGGQTFEAVGLADAVVEEFFTGTPSPIDGAIFSDLAREILARHEKAFAVSKAGTNGRLKLEFGGEYKYRKDGEIHFNSPQLVHALHEAVQTGSYEAFKEYTQIVHDREQAGNLRDLLRFKKRSPIPLEEVEPVSEICRRFRVAAMSHGALSRETHEALAIAINRIGGMSNTGEGGEDPARFKPRPNGDWPNSQIKQVASARFGVTTEYLMSATELNIKMAQGSKPGEGGQLPGHKVSAEIARIRYSVPGVTLISPPPHHDIYSIEDLAQLIYDLKQVNPKARVSVKLVAESGVGTIAAGVAKAYADTILISGHEGGTGASPLSSIKYAGIPWELGLAETQQVLVRNDLRGRVRLQTDGGMKTGQDVVIAALLGADEYGFGSAAVMSTGCQMIRVCHLNTCPVGVATQNPELRKKFIGKPEMVVNFFTFIALHVREILAELGFRSLREIIGRVDLLEQVPANSPANASKANRVRLDRILFNPDPGLTRARCCEQDRNDRKDEPLDETILRDAAEAIEGKTTVSLSYPIRNTNRTVGARVAGVIVLKHGSAGLPDGAIECHFTGSAGQSFGAFLVNGMRLFLDGEANDYVGKGMSGGEIVIRPPESARFETSENIIMGNTVMYGATGGILYAAGRAGERFCVRNSGGFAVVEGLGDHGCEYMTGGVVLCLGETGRNFGAGMTGGIAYVLDEKEQFPQHYNPELVLIERVTSSADTKLIRSLLAAHLAYTGSSKAARVLEQFEAMAPLFWKVLPNSPEALAPAADSLRGNFQRIVRPESIRSRNARLRVGEGIDAAGLAAGAGVPL